jgi:hypothetical protein
MQQLAVSVQSWLIMLHYNFLQIHVGPQEIYPFVSAFDYLAITTCHVFDLLQTKLALKFVELKLNSSFMSLMFLCIFALRSNAALCQRFLSLPHTIQTAAIVFLLLQSMLCKHFSKSICVVYNIMLFSCYSFFGAKVM